MASNQYDDIMSILGDQHRLEELYQGNPIEFSALMRNILRFTRNSQSFNEESTPDPDTTFNPEPAISSSGKSEKHPDPPIFNGNPAQWREFKTQLRVKLTVNYDRYKTSQSRLAYTVSRLQGNPLHIVQPKIINGVIAFNDYSDLLQFLDIAYEDPDLMVKAQRELRDLKQRNREFYLYFADFQRIIEDTGITDNEARKSALMGGLSTELLNLLVHHDIPGQFDDLVKLLQGLDSRYRLNRSRNQGYQFPRPQSIPNRPYRPIPRERERYSSSRPTYNPTLTPSLPPGEPMDLGASTRQKLSPEELNRRIQDNLCRYCGEPGHFVRNCPRSAPNPAKRPSSGQSNSGQSKNQRFHLRASQNEFKRNSSLPANSKNDKSLF